MKPLAKPATQVVKDGKLKFYPDRWTKVYLNWMENIEDWCISRQIWWGHRIPVWYCGDCTDDRPPEGAVQSGAAPLPHAIVSKTTPAKCDKCGSAKLKQDEDVLDTWFSSWLWPFSTLGWPAKTPDLDYFYPTNTLVTAQEIIFFWVARMVMAGFYCMKETPFTDVYIHGTVRDITGKKMSKSLGNSIDPLSVIEKVGTDALRYTLVTATAIGQDVFLSDERFTVGRNFANKLWNATRFMVSQPGWQVVKNPHSGLNRDRLSLSDRWILSRLNKTIIRVTGAIDDYQFNDAANGIYDFLWRDFCDWYLEIAKVQISQDKAETTLRVLWHALDAALRLLHPIMPFVTEELWQRIGELAGQPAEKQTIMRAEWPKQDSYDDDPAAETEMETLQAIVSAVRAMRSELHVPADSRPDLYLATPNAQAATAATNQESLLRALTQSGKVHVDAQRPKDAAAAVVHGVEVLLPLAGLVDAAQERVRLSQRVDQLAKQLAGTEARLGNNEFTSKAPPEILEGAKAQQRELVDALKKTRAYLATVEAMSK